MKRFLAFFLSLFLIFGATVRAEGNREPENLYAKSAVLMDAKSGRVLFEKNGSEVMAMASTTKIMTCILALENGQLDDIVTASKEASSQPKVHLGMKVGEQFYLKDLLYSLMLESHNDSAVAIAEHISGSTKTFADRMNEKAKELGCKNTYFITPNGLDASDEKGFHSTTATELAMIMSYCIHESPEKETFLEITRKASHQFSNVEGSRSFQCQNHNSFLNMMDGALSGKTGFTNQAGYCYVGSVERDGRTFVVALLACGWPNNKNYKWKDTTVLMNYAIDNYSYKSILDDVELPKLKAVNGCSENSSLFDKVFVDLKIGFNEQESTDKLLLRKDEEIEMTTVLPDNLEAPINENEPVGHIICSLEGEELCRFPVVAEHTVLKKNVSWCFLRVLKLYLLGTEN